MATLADVIAAEARTMKSQKEELQKNQIIEGCNLIIEQATEIAEKRSAFGDEAARELFATCEASMKVQLRTAAEHAAQFAALSSIHTLISENSSPQAVQDAYAKAVSGEKGGADDEANFANGKLKELRDIIARSDGAGPSGGDGDVDMDDEEGFTMTQTTSSHKCPLLQIQMTATGELRPVRAGTVHVFSYKGLTEFLKNKQTAPVPISGSSGMLDIKKLSDAKDIAKEIKRAARNVD